MTTLIVIAAGGVGAAARFGMVESVQTWLDTRLPWGTGVVNVAGTLLLGLAVGSGATGFVGESVVGFLAGFTTFSGWMVESEALWTGSRRHGVVNLVAVAAAALVAGGAGLAIGAAL